MKAKRKPDASGARRKALAEQGPLSRASLRLRIVFPAERQIGPGKADLLEAIGRTGSISSAARDLGMSYRRAWLLVDEMGKLFKRPLVTTAAGGAHGGGAALTDFGRALVAAYRRIEDRAAEAARAELIAFESDLDDV
ncbi:LysR family transcriptional regulator [Hyphomicrobium sp.]|uniref:winged helix-turn-helix domain-containing protein n=1 Tax=Hyphomicrobium sp. TaxID=82 RepID=UPI0025BA222D|nr:LysR family transcriptional regulator [Hyphomicrobium sp.]MCC7251797.1 LysR family transcriptional regulator [Hyphomicrobium sp.]